MTSRVSRRTALQALLAGTVLTGCRAIGITPPTVTATSQTTLSTTPSALPIIPLSPTPLQPIVSPSPIIAVSAGGSHSLALRADGKVWGWGTAANIGLSEENLYSPVELNNIQNIIYIDTDGWRSSLFVDRDSHMFRTLPDETPGLIELPSIDKVVKAKIERDTVVALRSDGSVWAYGDPNGGSKGLLGVEKWGETGKFTRLPVEDVRDFDIAYGRALFLRKDGSLWAWGDGPSLGINNASKVLDPPQPYPGISDAVEAALGSGLAVLRSDGRIWEYVYEGIENPFKFLYRVTHVYANGENGYYLAIDDNEFLWGWGQNADVLGLDPDKYDFLLYPIRIPMTESVVSASAGTSHVLALDRNGSVWSWGSGYSGQLGGGPISNDAVAFQPALILRSK